MKTSKTQKKNLIEQRKIERSNCYLNFIDILQKLYIYLDSKSKTDVVNKYLEHKLELDLLKTKHNVEKYKVSTALRVRQQIKHIKDTNDQRENKTLSTLCPGLPKYTT